MNGTMPICKKSVVIEDLIAYYRLYPCDSRAHNQKVVQFVNNFRDTLENVNTPIEDEKLNNFVIMLQKFYNSLKKRNEEHKTLETATRSCFKHLDIKINFSRGIVMQDGSLVIFHDLSRGISAYLESVIKQGSL